MTEDRNDDGTLPPWAQRNASLRAEMGLPAYEPPRFADGTPTHEVIDALEREYGCTLRFVGVDARYGDDWEVRIDGEPTFRIGRRRTETGNVVYQLTAETFRRRVAGTFDGDSG
jgi:hypothetical protein